MKKSIIITGASKGIGAYLFETYKQKRNEVYGTYNNTKPAGSESENLKQVDVSDVESIDAWISSIEGALENVVLINCAGISYNAFSHKADLIKWKKVVDVNLVGTFFVINRILPLMRKQKFGRIINLSSVVAQKGALGTSAYAASKAGLWGLSKTISLENASHNILINNINLGYMNAGMIEQIPEQMKEKLLKDIPCRSFGDLASVAKTIDYLIESDYVSGTSIDVNGGLY